MKKFNFEDFLKSINLRNKIDAEEKNEIKINLENSFFKKLKNKITSFLFGYEEFEAEIDNKRIKFKVDKDNSIIFYKIIER